MYARMVFADSAIDALSHYQLHPDVRTGHASTADTIGHLQQELIAAVVRQLPTETIVVLAHDRNGHGGDLLRRVRELAARACERVTSPIDEDWNECLNTRDHALVRAHRRRPKPCLSR